MAEFKIMVTEVRGTCTADPPMRPGDFFTVCDGNLRIREGALICLYALQSILPVLTPKGREILEDQPGDWMRQVHHAQCPDPAGRVIFGIERTATAGKDSAGFLQAASRETREEFPGVASQPGRLQDLRVVVEQVQGRCTSGMKPGDHFTLRNGLLEIPADRHFCLYALHAVLPLLPAKQRPLTDGDWLKQDNHVICPDPTGNVIMRIERIL